MEKLDSDKVISSYYSFNTVNFSNSSSIQAKLFNNLSSICSTELLVFQPNNNSQECFSQMLSNVNNQSMDELINATKAPIQVNTDRPFIPYWWVQIAWALVFGIMVFVSVVGNITVIWIVLAHRRMRTVTNFFLVNLTLADLATATFNAIFNFVFMLNSHWPFGQVYCVVNNFIANLTIASSVFTITATSIDRYIAIVYPLKPRMSKKKSITIIIMIWFCASIFAFPTLLFSKTLTYRYAKQELRTICILVWPDGPAGQSAFDNIYNILFLVLTYIVPMVSMAITYTLIARVLWGSKGIGEETELQKESIRSKKKVVRMLITVVVIFAFCWFPYHAYFLYIYHVPEVVHLPYIQHIYLAIYWLAMSNSMYNWIIYCWMNKRFRNYFKRYFCCLANHNWNDLSRQRTNGNCNTRSQLNTTRYDLVAMSSNNHHSNLAKRISTSITTKETKIDKL